MDRPLGHLERVDPVTVWSSEPREFIPWLAAEENLQRLGRTVGLDLEPVAEEVPVGRFRADLLCRDRGSGTAVVIEAQLGVGDHTHLGQLLTYAVELRNSTAVWIAARFHDEHRAVLDRLNGSEDANFRCLAVEMRLWTIGTSAVAPQFTLVAAPGHWTRAAAAMLENRAAEARKTRSKADAADPPPIDANRIKVRRLRRGITATQLAKAAEISRSYLSHLEAGRYRGSPETRAAIAKALDMPAHALVPPADPSP